MRRRIPLLLIGAILAALLFGCRTAEQPQKLHIVCTIFPQYDWVRQLLGDRAAEVELTLLLDSKVDLHSYQPSVEDIAKISACDLFVYVGGESDGWVADALAESVNPNMRVVSLMDALGQAVKTEEIVEGMEHDHEDEHDHEHEHEAEYDEHVWLSLQNAGVLCNAIADALAALDSDHAALYHGNLAAYLERLSALDGDYRAAVDAAPVKTLLFADRFPFRYLADDYGLEYYAAFAGCSAETEASFQTILFLAGKVDELGLGSILVTESADKKLAETVRDSTARKHQQILALNSMQSVAAGEIASGATYLAVMEENLAVLVEALQYLPD